MDLYHRREQLRKGEIPSTYRYNLDERVRTQLVIILQRSYDNYTFEQNGIYPLLIEEFPEILSGKILNQGYQKFQEILAFFLHCSDDVALSILEVMCICFDGIINPINDRLRYERVGYHYIKAASQILKIEDETYYNECNVRTLGILSQGKYQNTLTHYLSSYANLAKMRYNEALVDIGKAMESLLKSRLSENGIGYSHKDTLSPLLTKVGEHIKIPTDVKFEPIKQVILNAGRARNLGGHGHPDNQSHVIDDGFVRFVINQGAANLLFLAEAEFK